MKLLYFLYIIQLISCHEWDGRTQCPKICSCLESYVDCSNKELKKVPSDLPHWTKKLDLSNNSLQENGVMGILRNYPNLKEVMFDWNHFTNIPITSQLLNLSKLTISYNLINTWENNFWTNVPNLKLLDVSNNKIDHLNSDMFPSTSELTVLYLNDNKISKISKNSFDGLQKLKELKISTNLLESIGKDIFKQLGNLRLLELNRNKFTKIEGLTFKGLDKLKILKIRQNFVSSLEDGSFWGLQNLQVLKLDHNKIKNVSKRWTYGLTALQELHLGNNQIHYIERDAWEACKNLKTLDLSNNKIDEIYLSTFEHLTNLNKLKLNRNAIHSIHEGVFNSTPALKVLDLGHNKISWLIEDPSGLFVGLKELKILNLASNEITSINQKAFLDLTNLSVLDLTGNHIKTIQENAFISLNLDNLLMNTSSLICDCSLTWFQTWLLNRKITPSNIVCAYPETLKGKNLTSIPTHGGFLCSKNENPKPFILLGPESTVTVAGSSINISCNAWSSSNSSLIFKWKHNNIDVDSNNSITLNNTAYLLFNNVSVAHSGKYQCIVVNDFGIAYSKKATLKVLVLPVLVKKPVNLTVKAGSTAKLECSAIGEPTPQVGWQKDGGNEFPAAQERRMHVMHSDDVFFIVNAKPIDSGLYSCIAKNSAGTVKSNATLTVQEAPVFTKKMEDKEVKIGMSTVFECMGSGWPKPQIRWWKDGVLLTSSFRHFMTANDQLLIITDIKDVDAGTYQCEMSNLLGIEKTTAHLSIKSAYSSSCDDITGVIIISVVCCAVGTSAVWVIIIYQTRKHLSSNYIPKDILNTRTTLDNKSDNSSTSKDSGTGNSTKRSTEDFQLDVLAPQEILPETQDAPETSAQIIMPLLQNNFCSQQNEACPCSQVQRENTRSNHERCKNERPFSMPIDKTEVPSVVHIQSNSSYSCLYNSGKPTAV